MGFTQLPMGPIQAQVKVLAFLGDSFQNESGEDLRGDLLRKKSLQSSIMTVHLGGPVSGRGHFLQMDTPGLDERQEEAAQQVDAVARQGNLLLL